MGRCSARFGSRAELASPLFWRDLLGDLVSTVLLLSYITFAGFVNYKDGFESTPVHFGLAIGFVVFCLVESFSQFGGGIMNPAVTLLFVVRGDITIIKGFLYVLVQLLGGAAGSALVFGIVSPEERDHIYAVKPAPELGPWRGVMVEAVITSILCFVTLTVTDPKRATPHPLPGLPVGMAIATGILTAGMSTGGAMNPIASFGPAVVVKDFEQHWVYWLGPILGSIVALSIYLPFGTLQAKFGDDVETIEMDAEEEDIEKEVSQNPELTTFLRKETSK